MPPDPTWHPLKHPLHFERQIAFCVPSADRIVVMSYEGLHDLRLRQPPTVSTDESHAEDYDIYDARRLTILVDGSPVPALGLHGGCPFPTTADELSVHVNVEANAAEICGRDGQVILRSDHSACSPGWLVASFSEDGTLFVVGTPDRIWCWRRASTK